MRLLLGKDGEQDESGQGREHSARVVEIVAVELQLRYLEVNNNDAPQSVTVNEVNNDCVIEIERRGDLPKIGPTDRAERGPDWGQTIFSRPTSK